MDALIEAATKADAEESLAELQQVEEVGPRIAVSIREFFEEPKNLELIERLRKAGLQFSGKKKERGTTLVGKTFVLTGALSKYSRDEAKRMIEDAGARSWGRSARKPTTLLPAPIPAQSWTRPANSG